MLNSFQTIEVEGRKEERMARSDETTSAKRKKKHKKKI